MARTEVTGKQIKDQSVDLAVDVTGVLPVANGGTGSSSLTLNNVLLGNGTGALQSVSPGTAGNVLTSNGSTWVSAVPAAAQVTLNGSETLSNKTLTSPKIDYILDPNGAPAMWVGSQANAVNYAWIRNGAGETTGPQFRAAGPGTTIDVGVFSKGAGMISLGDGGSYAVAQFRPAASSPANYFVFQNTSAGGVPSLSVTGSDANVSINLISKGSGSVQANGIPVVTTTGSQTLSNKTLTNPKIQNINDLAGTVALQTATTGGTNFLQITNSVGNPGFTVVSNNADQSLFLSPKGSGTVRVFASSGNTPTLTGAGADANHNLNLQSQGSGVVQANGVPVVTTTGSQTLTNKTINSATINSPTLVNLTFSGTTTNSLTIGPASTNAHVYLAGPPGLPTYFAYAQTAGSYSYLSTAQSGVLASLSGDLIVSSRAAGKSIIFGTATSGSTDVERMRIANDGEVTVGGKPVTTAHRDFTNLAAGSDFADGTWGLWKDISRFTISNEQAHSGTYSIKLAAGSGGASAFLGTYPTVHEFKPGDQVYMEYWAYADDSYVSDLDGKLRIGAQDNSLLWYLFAMTNHFTQRNVWQKFSTTYTVPAGVSGLIFTLQWNTTSGNLWIDDIIIRRIPAVESLPSSVVTTTGSQILTNKTLTTPTINTPTVRGFLLKDSNDNNIAAHSNVTAGTGTSYLSLAPGTGSPGPSVSAASSETNTGLVFWTKGTGLVQFRSNANSGQSVALRLLPHAGGVNWLDISNAPSGSSPTLKSVSYGNTDTNVGLNLETLGSGMISLKSDNVHISGGSVTSLKVDSQGTAGRSELLLNDDGDTKAYVQWRGSTNPAIPNTLRIQTNTGVTGDIVIGDQGASRIFIAGGQNGLTAGRVGIGTATPSSTLDVNGEIRQQAVPVVTTTAAQTLTNKTISGASNTFSSIPATAVPGAAQYVRAHGSVANQWYRIFTFAPPGNPWFRFSAVYAISCFSQGGAVIAVHIGNWAENSVGGNVEFLGKGTLPLLAGDSFKLVGDGYGQPFELWVKTTASGSALAYYEISRYGSGYTTYDTSNTPQSAEPVGQVLNVRSSGLASLEVGTATTTATTFPAHINLGGTYGNSTPGSSNNLKLRLFDDGTDSNRFGLGISNTKLEYQVPSTSTHRFYVGGTERLTVSSSAVQVAGADVVTTTAAQTLTNKTINSATLNSPTIGSPTMQVVKGINGGTVLYFADGGPGTNYLSVVNRAPGYPPYFRADGGDANIGINFLPKGSGIVTVKDVPVVTTTDSQTLTNKTLTSPTINSPAVSLSSPSDITATVPTNQNLVIGGGVGGYPAYSPVGKYLWHDLLRFSRHGGLPTYETSANGTTWTSASLNKNVFDGKESFCFTLADGSTTKGVRWTWHSWNFAFCGIEWWAIGFCYTNPAPAVTALVESSPDGTTWTTLHSSTFNASTNTAWLPSLSNGSHTRIRLTLVSTNGAAIRISSVKALSYRPGDQGSGAWLEQAYDWDADRNIYAPQNLKVLNPQNTTQSAVTVDASQTLTNKTLTSPKMNQVLDANGAGSLLFTATTSGVNYTELRSGQSGGANQIRSIGSDTNINMMLVPKGSGGLQLYAGTTSPFQISVSSANTNQSINIATKGSGTVNANGVPVVTTTDSQTLTNKTISGSSNTLTNIPPEATPNASRRVALTPVGPADSNRWTKIMSFDCGTQLYNDGQALLAITPCESGANDSVIISVKFRTSGSGQNPNPSVAFLGAPEAGIKIGPQSFKIVNDGFGLPQELWMKKVGSYTQFAIYELSRAEDSDGAGWITYHSNYPWQSAEPTGTAINVTSDGVKVFGDKVVSETATQTLTNKTLTTPVINGLPTGTGVSSAATGNTLAARNSAGDTTFRYLHAEWVSNSHAVVTRNSDTAFYSTNDNYIRKNTATGFKTSLALNNVDNTSDATKNSAVATLTNKTLTSPTISTPTINGTTTISGDVTVDNGTSSLVVIRSDDTGTSGLLLRGQSQGTSYIEVTQDGSYGGGMSFFGGGGSTFATGESTDSVTFYRKGAGTRTAVFSYGWNSNNVNFAGNIAVAGNITSGGIAVPTISSSSTLTNKTISGSSNTLTNISISSLSNAPSLFNNMGEVHQQRTSFDAQGAASTVDFGWRYVQGSTNGPGTNSATQYYSQFIGLGSNYAYNTYGMQIAYPRNVTSPYISIRYQEGSVFGSWRKISAGYADSAGDADTLDGQHASAFVTPSGTATLTNKTITSPTFTGTAIGPINVMSNLINLDDWNSSPISIRERQGVANTNLDDKYSPNLNFHWASRVSNSLWMNTNGQLNWGSYSGTGVPAANGTINAANFNGNLNGNATTASSASSITGGIPNNSNYEIRARVIRNSNSTASNDGLYIGYSNTNGGDTRLYGGGNTTNPVSVSNGGTLTVPGVVASDEVRCITGQQLVFNAGESRLYYTSQTSEKVYLNAEQGIEIVSSPDNWASGWAGRNTATICNNDGVSSFPGNIYINGVIVPTISSTHTLTNKTLTSPTISDPVINGNATGTAISTANTANTLVKRDGNGDFYIRYVFSSYLNMSHGVSGTTNDTIFYSSKDNYIRKNNASGFKSSLGLNNVDNTSDATKNSATATLTNKRITPRIGSVTSTATPSINADIYDQYNITALATNITSVTITGTPTDGQKLMLRIKDNGTARAITWGASFVSSGTATLLTTTVVNKTHLVGLLYDSAAAKWVCIAADSLGY